MIEASGLWVPIVLLLSVLGLGFMLGWIWGSRRRRVTIGLEPVWFHYSGRDYVTGSLYAPGDDALSSSQDAAASSSSGADREGAVDTRGGDRDRIP